MWFCPCAAASSALLCSTRFPSIVNPLFKFYIFEFSLATAERNLTNLTGNNGLPGLYLANTFSAPSLEQNLTKLDMKQDLKVIYEVCV